MSHIDDENSLNSSLDKYLLNDDYNDSETSLLPNEMSNWLDDSLTQSNDQLSLLMREFDFDIDLFTSKPIESISTDLPLCNADIDFESKLVDEICNETSSRHSPISADSGNHSPSSISSEAVSEIWPMSSVNPSDRAASPSANTFTFDTGDLKKDECIVRNQENLDVLASSLTGIDSKDGKTAMEIKPLITTIHTTKSEKVKPSAPMQTPTHLVPVQISLQQVVSTTSQVNLTPQPVICLLPASSNSSNVEQKQREVYVKNNRNIVQLTSSSIGEGGCMRSAHYSPSISNRVQPYPPIRPKLIIPKREAYSPPPTLPLIVTPRTVSVPTTKATLLTPFSSLPAGLQIIECKATSSSSNITRNPSVDSGFDEFTRKKEDRKIRNRASAQLSRIRKRYELDEMKQKLADKDVMIATLRKENDLLKGQLVQLQNENNILKRNIRGDKISGRTGAAATGAACLFVMIMMVTINSPIFSRLNPISPPTESYSRQFPLDSRDEDAKSTLHQHGRALLAVDYDADESNRLEGNGGLRLKRDVKEIVEITPTINVSNIAADCNETTTLYMNQTEAIRLNNDLSNWVDRHERLNFLQTRRIFRAPSPRSRAELGAENVSSSMSKTRGRMHSKQTRSVISRTRRSTNDKKEEARLKAVRERAWRHIDMISAGTSADNDQPKRDSGKDGDLKASISNENYVRSSKKTSSAHGDRSAFDLFVAPSLELQYMELARALKQRDDTLYVVAMKDYYLLPATDRNSTMRPRVALILPALSYNGTLANQVAMMRIECEIMGTGLFHIAESLLPLFYNQSFYQLGQ
uniref:BZIP domain-containing protein n=1 Tax=Parascaris univalens TaxID=6257 RepID=A0A915A7D8_PARUN